MALHGDICVNGYPIGYWKARRTEALRGHDEEHEYEVTVRIDGIDGPTLAAGTVRHRYSDGPVVLARKALGTLRGDDTDG